jgi:hypothetical protein
MNKPNPKKRGQDKPKDSRPSQAPRSVTKTIPNNPQKPPPQTPTHIGKVNSCQDGARIYVSQNLIMLFCVCALAPHRFFCFFTGATRPQVWFISCLRLSHTNSQFLPRIICFRSGNQIIENLKSLVALALCFGLPWAPRPLPERPRYLAESPNTLKTVKNSLATKTRFAKTHKQTKRFPNKSLRNKCKTTPFRKQTKNVPKTNETNENINTNQTQTKTTKQNEENTSINKTNNTTRNTQTNKQRKQHDNTNKNK